MFGKLDIFGVDILRAISKGNKNKQQCRSWKLSTMLFKYVTYICLNIDHELISL